MISKEVFCDRCSIKISEDEPTLIVDKYIYCYQCVEDMDEEDTDEG